MSSLLYSVGRWAYRARALVVIVWIGLLALLGGGALLFNQGTDNSFSIPGTESQEALDTLSRTFPQVSGTTAQIVVVAPDGQTVDDSDIKQPIEDTVDQLKDVNGVSGVSSPYSTQVKNLISDDRSAAIITVQLKGQMTTVTDATKTAVKDAGADLAKQLPDGSKSAVGGQLFSQNLPTLSVIELVGVLIALVVLILTFGSFLAAGMPLLTAILGVAISMCLIFIATLFGSISSTTPMLALMLGLAVGIDYSLFIISRHQAQLKSGVPPEESAARAVATAGSAVLFAGITVIIALAGLAVANIPFLTTMGIAASVGVAVAVLVALTMTPALLGFAGARLTPGRRKAARAAKRGATAAAVEGATEAGTAQAAPSAADSPEPVDASVDASAPSFAHAAKADIPPGFFRGWVRAVIRFPIVTVVAVIVALGIAALPALQLRLALPDAGSQPEGAPARVAYDLVSDHFGPGYNGPLIVTGSIISSTDPVGLMTKIGDEIADLPGVASVPLATPNATADTGIVQVVPTTGPNDQKTADLVAEIRAKHQHFLDEYGVDLKVTGNTAAQIDVSSRLAGALLPFGILVVGLSLILLTMVFRSIAVPIKAALGYLLSVGAAFGAVTVVFEWGWLADLLHVDKTGPIISFMPIILMGVLFGLAMDYEVFLVSRMREDYVHGGDARRAIQSGFVSSAKVVTAAAIIMISVFAAFVPEGDASIKPIALGLAVGVFVDAFIVRMTLVPAVLQLLGEKAWWMPRWLDRILPSFDVEGDGLQKELELANWPVGGQNLVAAADGLTVSTRKRRLVGDVSFRLADGEVLVVHGDDRTAAVALLMAVTGRTPVDGGTVKVAGLVLPVRGAAVRSRTAIVRLDAAETPVEDLRHALAGRPQLLALDAVDSVTDPIERRRIRAELTAALSRARVEERPFALVVSCVEPAGLDDLLPESAEPTEVDLSAGPGPRAVTAPDLTDPDRAEHGAHLEKTNA
ncbi:putative drug exporter of the RND superfamily [Leifsonia sp. 98AMF]|uniref:MMPL family transporter n=1 Tax=unclassified Leifsonia TaxID=2663824 RepID=UPI00087CB30D|nr:MULTISPECIES: MMPL family transporter [unclassified Leifsonia]SDH28704.1 putative drug exporter of the RND superfamily [Leifsonia sp. 197AMF]SDJ09403.1 putative drug exporter of the RND superfamily [Leifsonia sp. 466MF]SDJ61293.1 putative drug exporter of the RND superfamily [Leifsonia sp. 157MF]SDN30580.1 putative drug exporter of the RND superfamily [Leifsonia sp. 509MF]SEM90626.1 putative drug exporter of the RND superfamily [Leifsonia sp. 467MF]